jgi:hypothetical protein
MWGLVITYGAFIVLGAVGILVAMSSSSGPATMAPIAIISCVGAIGLLVFGIWWLILLFAYRRQLVAQAAAAEHSWASLPIPPAAGVTPPATPPLGS